jgi:hypothetical protein
MVGGGAGYAIVVNNNNCRNVKPMDECIRYGLFIIIFNCYIFLCPGGLWLFSRKVYKNNLML